MLVAPENEEDWNKSKKISRGAPLTLNPAGKGIGLYEGHLDIDRAASHEYSKDILQVHRLAAREAGWFITRFKSNIDAIDQIETALKFGTDGIGLVRTEHLALFDPQSHKALCRIMAGEDQDSSSYETLKERQQEQMEEIFEIIQKCRPPTEGAASVPVRIRLLDPLMEEFFSRKEIARMPIVKCLPMRNLRGVQMGIANPKIYQNQLAAIFEAYINKGAEKSGIELEIMVPTVKIRDELSTVKRWAFEEAKKAAESNGISPLKFRFGTMIETVEAISNAKTLAALVDFVSIGSNDLTRSVHGDPSAPLNNRVIDMISTAVRDIRSVNSKIDISLCGAHATDLASLKSLSSLGLDYSVPPSLRNLYAIPVELILYNYREKRVALQRENKPATYDLR